MKPIPQFHTLAGWPEGTNGVPTYYTNRKVKKEKLYDLVNDISETTDVLVQHPGRLSDATARN